MNFGLDGLVSTALSILTTLLHLHHHHHRHHHYRHHHPDSLLHELLLHTLPVPLTMIERTIKSFEDRTDPLPFPFKAQDLEGTIQVVVTRYPLIILE